MPEAKDNKTKQGCIGCLGVLAVSLVVAVIAVLCEWGEGDPLICGVMQEINYDYERVHELKDANVLELRQIQYAWENITPYSEGLKLYCTDPNNFFWSEYDIYDFGS